MASESSSVNLPSPSIRASSVTADYRGLLVILPTRNRADLAIRAIRSVLDAACDDVRLVVSDNSTDEAEVARLDDFRKGRSDERIRYVRPPEPLAMASHWEWIFEQVLSHDPANHFTVLGDRRVFRKGALREIVAILKGHPDRILVYDQIMINELKRPIQIWQRPWSGQLFEVDSADVLRVNAHAGWHAQVPVLQNSVVTRGVLTRVREQFGNRFLSIAPDFAFGFRSLDVVDQILLYDKPLIIGSALDRSNGFSFTRGVKSQDTEDFFATNPLLERGFYATPIPRITTANNATFHEYGVVRAESRSGRLPAIDLPSYLRQIRVEVQTFLEDPELKREFLRLLEEKGFQQPEPTPPTAPDPATHSEKPGLATGAPGLRQRVRSILDRPPLRPIRWVLSRCMHPRRTLRNAFARRSLRHVWRTVYHLRGRPIPPWATYFVAYCDSIDEAIDYLNVFQQPSESEPHSLLSSLPIHMFYQCPLRPIPVSSQAGRERGDRATSLDPRTNDAVARLAEDCPLLTPA
jgi:hypothetical protein